MKEMGGINSGKEQKNQGMHKNEDRQGCRGVVMVATRGEMNLNISSSHRVTEERAHIWYNLWEFAIPPPWSGAALKVIELANI